MNYMRSFFGTFKLIENKSIDKLIYCGREYHSIDTTLYKYLDTK